MERVETWLGAVSDLVWGPAMLALLFGVGVYLTVGLRFATWRGIGSAFRQLWESRRAATGDGEISPYASLMTALAATVGTGNIAGVGTAVALGGPGALFWMWLTALFGMATKYAEAVLAVQYRERDLLGQYVGGPMYYIKNGLGPRWRWMGGLFAVFATVAAFGIGNTVQANSVADALEASFHVPPWAAGVVMALLAGAVLLGGVRRLAEVASRLVPVMAVAYVGGALVIILSHAAEVPRAFATIVEGAFSGTAAAGGFVGATVWAAVRFGVARGVFSNEAGMGSAAIVHAAARTDRPVSQGPIAMLGTFLDTLVICTMTGLVLVLTGAWASGETGAALTASAFESGLPGVGQLVVTIGLVLFAFSTILGWGYYGERCSEYLFGIRSIRAYRLLWVLAIPVGAVAKLGAVWLLADIMNGLMAIPNLIAVALLSPVVFRLTREARRARARAA